MTSGSTAYFLGKTPTLACQADPRFSSCAYVPATFRESPLPPRLLVAMHDTLRNHHAMRDAFVEYADRTNTLVLAPLFPGGIGIADDLDNYKYLRFRDIRFDEVLLAMTGELARRYGIDDARFDLFGFSGGAHFAHRFLYVHPDRLASLVVASPGSVTLPTEEHQWWPGIGNFSAVFGRPIAWDQVRRVPVRLMVGINDTNPRGIVQSSDNPNWVEGAAAAGANRVERMRSLHEGLRQRGADVSLEELPGVAHEFDPVVQAAIRYFERAQAPAALAAR